MSHMRQKPDDSSAESAITYTPGQKDKKNPILLDVGNDTFQSNMKDTQPK